MCVHIRHREEHTYLSSNGEWVPEMKSARAFANAREATEYCRAEKLKGMELVILRPPAPPLTMPLHGQNKSG
jgi:hypothetical protein